MPLNAKGKKIMAAMKKQYGAKAKEVFYASENNYNDAKQKLEEAKQKGYSTAFIVAYKDGIKINVTDAIK